jgi:uncharacterized membrane protein YtjA (UPF0391 family)
MLYWAMVFLVGALLSALYALGIRAVMEAEFAQTLFLMLLAMGVSLALADAVRRGAV